MTIKTFLFAAICILFASFSAAQPLQLDQAKTSPPHPENTTERAKPADKNETKPQPAPPPVQSNVNVTAGSKLEPFTQPQTPKPPVEVYQWFGEFFNVKITDVVIAAFTIMIGIFTLYLYKATAKLADISSLQERSTKTIERAYVKMSHKEPGLLFSENETVRFCEVIVQIENCGRTPATVTDVRLNAWVGDWDALLPNTPNYGQQSTESVPNGFLVPTDYFFLPRTFPLGKKDGPNPRTGQVRLCLFGYIDYIDAFGERQRAGYGREYRRGSEHNLVFIGQPGYNYDRPREIGEGNDWNYVPSKPA